MYRIQIFFICVMYAISSLVGNAFASTTRVVRARDNSQKKTSGMGILGRVGKFGSTMGANKFRDEVTANVVVESVFDADASATTVTSDGVTSHYAPAPVVRECARGYYATGAITFNGKTFYTACTKCPTYNKYDTGGGLSYNNAAQTSESWNPNTPLASDTECYIPKGSDGDGPYFVDEVGMYDYAGECYKSE